MVRYIRFINENFLTISAAATAIGGAAALIFITGYLIVFDSSLVWIIEYTDIIKFVIVAASIITVAIAVIGGLSDLISIIHSKSRLKYIIIGGLYLLIIVSQSIKSYEFFRRGATDSGAYEIINAMLALSALTLIYMIADYWKQIRIENRFTSNQNFAIAVFFIITIQLLGLSYGYRLKSQNKDLKQIHLKDKSNVEYVFPNSKIVIFLSHHVVFEADKKIHVVPSADVIRISSEVGK